MARLKTNTLLVVIALVSHGVAKPAEVPRDLRTVPVANALGLDPEQAYSTGRIC